MAFGHDCLFFFIGIGHMRAVNVKFWLRMWVNATFGKVPSESWVSANIVARHLVQFWCPERYFWKFIWLVEAVQVKMLCFWDLLMQRWSMFNLMVYQHTHNMTHWYHWSVFSVGRSSVFSQLFFCSTNVVCMNYPLNMFGGCRSIIGLTKKLGWWYEQGGGFLSNFLNT